MADSVDVIVVGGGPAGLTAALFTARRGLRTIVLTEDIGGQAATTGLIENYPGVDPTDGLDLMLRFKSQADAAGAVTKLGRVTAIEKTERGFRVRTQQSQFIAPVVILAFGLTHRKLGIPGRRIRRAGSVIFCFGRCHTVSP